MGGDQRWNLPTARPQTSLLDCLSLANGSHRGSPELWIHRLPKSPPEGIVVGLLSSRPGAGIPPLSRDPVQMAAPIPSGNQQELRAPPEPAAPGRGVGYVRTMHLPSLSSPPWASVTADVNGDCEAPGFTSRTD